MKEYVGKILMIAESYFPVDERIRIEALKLTENGYFVSVLCLSEKNKKYLEEWNNILIYRIPMLKMFDKSRRNITNRTVQRKHPLIDKFGYIFKYFYFTIFSFFFSIIILFRDGFDLIHAHNPPDTISFWAVLYKLIGIKIIYDIHDLSPEMYQARFKRNKDIIYKCLILAEKFSCVYANLVISTNNSYKEIVEQRHGVNPKKVHVVRNGPDLNRVFLHPQKKKLKSLNKTIIGYVGNMNPQDGVDYLIRALNILKNELSRDDFFAVLIGQGDMITELKKMVYKFNLNKNILFTGFIPDKEMFTYVSTADLCVSPDPYNDFTNISTWVKIIEYMALGKPIVAFELKETKYSAQDSALYARPNDEYEFAVAIQKLMDNPGLRDKMGKIGKRRIKEELGWKHVSKNLIKAYQYMSNNSKNVFTKFNRED
jgi:glycosyltransferase involved in cell wall biosynthesis